jgi:hypothetical protein
MPTLLCNLLDFAFPAGFLIEQRQAVEALVPEQL